MSTGPAAPPPTDLPDPAAVADALFQSIVSEPPPRRPASTYRVQMHAGFTFNDLTAAVDYLNTLGISDVYLSPFLKAKPGSTHGYDVFDHGRINPEIGDEASHQHLIETLQAAGMGRLLDVVPNHMGINGPNPFWLDVLECGAISPSARFFDIDWYPVKAELENRVLLPILEDQYGKVLESGKLRLERVGGSLYIHYYDTRLPLAPRSYALVLGHRLPELQSRFAPDDPRLQEYISIWSVAHRLPGRFSHDPEDIDQTLREKEVIKRRLERLCREAPEICEFLDETLRDFAGNPDDPGSYDPMHELLEAQVYRLAYWRTAADEINYRRFFDINDLAGLRTEDPSVFDESHRLILRWVGEGGVTGLRIDHPDGLADPLGYFQRLQERVLLQEALRRHLASGSQVNWRPIRDALTRLHRERLDADPSYARRYPIVVEKILSRGETLPAEWPVDGTVGYEYLNTINGLFIDPSASESIDATYAEFTGDRRPFADILYESKRTILTVALASELNVLARQLNRVSENDRRSRDFTLYELRRALREVIASFQVYRTYIRPGDPVSQRDVNYVDQAIARARHRDPSLDASVFAFVRESLLLEHPPASSEKAKRLREAFVVRFQQITGPAQAKGLEDTAFYRHYPLASRNEVGADPSRFGISPATFHAANAERLKDWPGTLGPTATHDTKRGEDTRLRIDALGEVPDDWKTHLARWSRWNSRFKSTRGDAPVPDTSEEYLLYQTLLGAWPLDALDDAPPEEFVNRIQLYMSKSLREAKRNTSWTDRDTGYVDAVSKFVADILTGPESGPFLKDFIPFQRRLARAAMIHSLSQTLLKVLSPGIPDVYQGTELWDLSLVDPDNRRPVDYDRRRSILTDIRRRLDSGESRASLASSLLASPNDGAIKLYTLWTALNERRARPDLYATGAYRPLEFEGARKSHLVGFSRYLPNLGGSLLIVPRLVNRLTDPDRLPLGPDTWTDTLVHLPPASDIPRYRNLLTDELHEPTPGDTPSLPISTLLQTFPAALLIPDK